jgi:hypothetical protein
MLIVLYSILLTSAAETILEFLPIGLHPDSDVGRIVVFVYALAVVILGRFPNTSCFP